jgi:hypothetical protein
MKTKRWWTCVNGECFAFPTYSAPRAIKCRMCGAFMARFESRDTEDASQWAIKRDLIRALNNPAAYLKWQIFYPDADLANGQLVMMELFR